MKICERCNLSKRLCDFYKCSARKDGKQGYCKSCNNFKSKERLSKNPEISRRYWLKRKDSSRYKEQCRRASEKYRKANKEKTNKAVSAWMVRNLDKHCSYQGMRRAKKIQATPAWANHFLIEEAYDLAKRRTEIKAGGITKWHVDHIVPLSSDLVCGLHVENNLQVIPSTLNASKGNRYWPDMPVGNYEV